MARRVRSKDLATREARRKLKVSGRPHYQEIGRGLHIGYRKGARNGVWVVRRYLGEQSYRVETIALADDTEDADGDQVLDFWMAQDRARGMRSAPIRVATVGDAIRSYITFLGDGPSGYDVRRKLTAYVDDGLKATALADLTDAVIREWHRKVARTPLLRGGRPIVGEEAVRRRQATANSILSWFKAALNHANRDLGLPPIWQKVRPFKNVHIPRSRYLTVTECQALIEAADDNFRILARAALHTGARLAEILRLTAADLDANTLRVRRSKSGKWRHIYLTDEGAAFFAALGATDHLIAYRWTRQEVGRAMAAACKRAGIEGACFHTLRHTYASLTIMSGAPLAAVAANLGHADTMMVMKVYGHLSQNYVADAMRVHAPKFEVSQ